MYKILFYSSILFFMTSCGSFTITTSTGNTGGTTTTPSSGSTNTSSKKKSSSSSTTSSTPRLGSAQGQNVVASAKKYIGTKYSYGGISKSGMDCSGLIYTVFDEYGVSLPRTSISQSAEGTAVYIGELQPGDLIFFSAKKGNSKISHAGIVSYSDGKTVKMIHSSTSKGVIEVDIANYWKDKYVKARRIF